jgi:hypothetical protein
MNVKEIEGVVKARCPFQRATCALAYLGQCQIVRSWAYDHRAHWMPPVSPALVAARQLAPMQFGRRRA